MDPFLKWAGGKRWLVRTIQLPPYERLIEPFLGSGAVFFEAEPKSAIISDVNPELINLYECVRDFPQEIAEALKRLDCARAIDNYYKIRAASPSSAFARAVRTLYLNRTCWNGLYRVNRLGQFNVPRGTKTKIFLDTDNFEGASKILRRAKIFCDDFEMAIAGAGYGDLIFADPPYTVKHNNNGFVKYNESIFSWKDQERLYSALCSAKKRGAAIIVTNADHNSVLDLYRDEFSYFQAPRASVLSGKAASRTLTTEAVFTANIESEIFLLTQNAEQSRLASSARHEIVGCEVGVF